MFFDTADKSQKIKRKEANDTNDRLSLLKILWKT